MPSPQAEKKYRAYERNAVPAIRAFLEASTTGVESYAGLLALASQNRAASPARAATAMVINRVGSRPLLHEATVAAHQKQTSSASTWARLRSSIFARKAGVLRNMPAFLPPRWRTRMIVSASSYFW